MWRALYSMFAACPSRGRIRLDRIFADRFAFDEILDVGLDQRFLAVQLNLVVNSGVLSRPFLTASCEQLLRIRTSRTRLRRSGLSACPWAAFADDEVGAALRNSLPLTLATGAADCARLGATRDGQHAASTSAVESDMFFIAFSLFGLVSKLNFVGSIRLDRQRVNLRSSMCRGGVNHAMTLLLVPFERRRYDDRSKWPPPPLAFVARVLVAVVYELDAVRVPHRELLSIRSRVSSFGRPSSTWLGHISACRTAKTSISPCRRQLEIDPRIRRKVERDVNVQHAHYDEDPTRSA